MSETLQCTLLPVPDDVLDGLSSYIRHSWTIFRLSPLQNFNLSDRSLKKYALVLRKRLVCSSQSDVQYKTTFTAIPSLIEENSEDVKIEVTVSTDGNTFNLKYCGILLTPLNCSNESNNCPLLLSKGYKRIKDATQETISLMFECVVQQYHLCENDFKWICGILAAIGMFKKNNSLTFTYVLHEEAMKEKIHCSLSAESLHKAWNRLRGRGENILKDEIDLMYECILEHFRFVYRFDLRYCILIDAKYPLAHVRKDGTIRVADEHSLYEILNYFVNAAQALGPLIVT